jgi:hypothetical protein
MSEISFLDVTSPTTAAALKSSAGQCQPNERVQALNCHCRKGGFAWGFGLQVGGDAANAAEATSPIPGQF